MASTESKPAWQSIQTNTKIEWQGNERSPKCDIDSGAGISGSVVFGYSSEFVKENAICFAITFSPD
jgi:hypothetical protein